MLGHGDDLGRFELCFVPLGLVPALAPGIGPLLIIGHRMKIECDTIVWRGNADRYVSRGSRLGGCYQFFSMSRGRACEGCSQHNGCQYHKEQLLMCADGANHPTREKSTVNQSSYA